MDAASVGRGNPDTGAASSFVAIITVSGDLADVIVRLLAVPGVRIVRELPPSRVVVVLHARDDAASVGRLPGVVSIVEDRLEHPTHD